MAALRHNRPTIIIYGGTIQPGIRHVDCPAMGYKRGDTVNISDAFESFGKPWTQQACFLLTEDDIPGAFTVGKINDEERFDVVRHACPGPGGCGGMYT